MELFQAKDHYILQSGDNALWCSRKDGSMAVRPGNAYISTPSLSYIACYNVSVWCCCHLSRLKDISDCFETKPQMSVFFAFVTSRLVKSSKVDGNASFLCAIKVVIWKMPSCGFFTALVSKQRRVDDIGVSVNLWWYFDLMSCFKIALLYSLNVVLGDRLFWSRTLKCQLKNLKGVVNNYLQ